MGDYNHFLLKIEVCEFSHNFLFSLQSCCFVPTIDKPMRVQNYYSYLIDNILVNNPDQVSISGNIISDISDHFSQFFFIYILSLEMKKHYQSKPKCAISHIFTQFATSRLGFFCIT